MDILKKNIGIIVYTVVVLGLIGLVFGLQRKAQKHLNAAKEAGVEQRRFLESVRGGEFALNKENQEIARGNRTIAEMKLEDLRGHLYQRYTVPFQEDMSSLKSVRFLQEECVAMQRQLIAKDISCPSRYFSFEKIATASTLPPQEQVPVILRKLNMVKEIVNLVTTADWYLAEIKSIQLLNDLDTVDKGTYLVTPIQLNVSGRMPAIQSFVNALLTNSKYLFFVHRVELTVVENSRGPGRTVGPSSFSPNMEDMMPPPLRGTPGRTQRGRPEAQPVRTKTDGTEEAVPLTKQDRLWSAGEPVLQASIRVDIVEFPNPYKDQEFPVDRNLPASGAQSVTGLEPVAHVQED